MMDKKSTHNTVFGILFMMAFTLSCAVPFSMAPRMDQADVVATQVSLRLAQTLEASGQGTLAEPPSGEPLNVSYNGTSFSSLFGGTVVVQQIPEMLETEEYLRTPSFDRIELNGYPVTGHSQLPVVQVFPVGEYRTVNAIAGEEIDGVQSAIISQSISSSEYQYYLYFLPFNNLVPIIRAKEAFLDFQNGRGMRYITQFSQSFTSMNNREMIYTYQGITSDGRFYISVIMPLSHPALSMYDESRPTFTFDNIPPGFFIDQTNLLNSQPEESFTPSLADLDAMMRSLKVEK